MLKNKKKFVAVIPIWGDKYIESFFKKSLPSLLSKDNFFFIDKNYQFEVCFITIKKCRSLIKKNLDCSNFKFDYNIINIPYRDNSDFPLHKSYVKTFKKYNQTKNKPYFILLNSDSIFTNTFFKEVIQELEKKNYNLVLDFPLRIKISKEKKFENFTYKNLLKFAHENLSNFTKMSICNSNDMFDYNSNYLVFKINNKNFIISSFLLHPIIFRPKHKSIKKGLVDFLLAEKYSSRSNTLILNNKSNKIMHLAIDNNNHKFNLDFFNAVKYAINLSFWTTKSNRYYSNSLFYFIQNKISKNKMNKFKKILNEIHSSLRFFENKDSEKHPYYLKKN